jgi:Zn-dependent protease with chaperone function
MVALLAKQQWDVERVCRRASQRRVFGVPVHMVGGSVACTAGPLRPRILLGAQVLESLDDDELRAVVLHERAHQLRLDPLRAALVAVVRAVTPSPLRRAATASQVEARREIRADLGALRRGATRRALAASLLKLPAAPLGVVGFASVSELRVRALLDDVPTLERGRYWPVALVGSTAGAAFCLMGLEAMLLSSVVACCV